MRLPIPRRFGRFQPLWALLALSCDPQTSVEDTIPSSRDDGVSPRTIIAVQISNSITDKDTSASDPKNMNVTGDLSDEPYTGTIELVRRKEVRHGMTVEDFQNRKKSGTDQANPTDTKTSTRKDTIVFLLPSGTTFKDGETIRVKVSKHITSHQTTIPSKSFSFRVSGSAAQGGDLKICTTRPAPGALNESARARIAAVFNRSVRPDGLLGAITLRGSQSGVHTGGDIVTKADGQNRVSEVTRRLAENDSFLPGEEVDVTYGSAILEAGSGPPATAQKLSPHLLSFQVGGGQMNPEDLAKTLIPLLPSSDAGPPVAILPADFRKKTEGLEFVVVGESGLSLFSMSGSRVWTRTDAPIPSESGEGHDTFKAVDAALYDMEGNGIPRIVVLLSGSRGSRLQIFEVQTSGAMAAKNSVDFPAVQVRKMLVADLSSDGKPEILVNHPAVTFIPQAGEKAKSTGNLTVFQLVELPPDPTKIDVGDPSTLKSTLSFQRLDNPLPAFELSTRIEAADLNGDGKLDLIAQTDLGVSLYRNTGTIDRPVSMRVVERLEGRAGSLLQPLAWVVGDVDGDGSQDILAWDTEGALSYRNHKVARCQANASATLVPTLLSEHVAPRAEDAGLLLTAPAEARALDLDGNGTLDLVILKRDGDIAILLGSEPASEGNGALAFTLEERPAGLPPGSDSPGGLAVADLDGDFGLDIAALAGSSAGVGLHLSEGVTVPLVSSFELSPLGGGSVEDGSTVRVVVRGSLIESYSGYSLALAYDSTRLTYRDFKEPVSDLIESTSRCPDERLQGCPGNASAQVIFKRPQEPGETDLGTFLFEKKRVSSPETATVSLTSFVSNNTTFSNTLRIVEGGSPVDVPVEIAGPPLEITVEPPPPEDLVILSTVVGRGVGLDKKPCFDCTVVHVSWSSPAGLLLSGLMVQVGGEPAQLICPEGGECPVAFDVLTRLSGPFTVTLTALDDQGHEVTAKSGELVGVYRPTVTACDPAEGQVRIAWDAIRDVDHYVVFRNSKLFATVEDTTLEIADVIPENPPATITYEVAGELKGVRGPRGACVAELQGDTDPTVTAPPKNVSAKLLPRSRALDPNTLSVQWENGEKYDDDDGIEVTVLLDEDRRVISIQKLPGTLTELTYEGDGSHGGVAPQDYVFSVRGIKGLRPSVKAESSKVKVPLPSLAVSLSCQRDNAGNVLVSWQDVWQGYDALKLTVQAAPTQEIFFDVKTRSYLARGLEAAGIVRIKLEALYDQSTFPPPPRGQEPKLAVSCGDLTYATQVRVGSQDTGGRVETGIGLSGIEIPIEAILFGVVNDFELELEYPERFQISSEEGEGLRLSDPGAQVVAFTPGLPASRQGAKKVAVKVTGMHLDPNADGDGRDGQTTLATLVGSLEPGDFDAAGEWPLTFTGATRLNGQALSTIDRKDGKLVVRRRFVYLNRAEVAADSRTPVPMVVKATFDAPPGAEGYRLNGYQIHLTWDPSLLELQEVLEADQKDTAVFGRGSLILPNEDTFEKSRSSGHLRVAWLGFDLSSGKPGFLLPGNDLNLLFVKFLPVRRTGAPKTFAPVHFVLASPENCNDGEDNDGDELIDTGDPDCRAVEDCDNKVDDDGDKLVDADDPDCPPLVTLLLPEKGVLNTKALETGLDGGILINGSGARPFSIQSLSPARGALPGGHTAVLRGSGFLLDGRNAEDFSISLVPSSGGEPIAVSSRLTVEARRIEFELPPAPASLTAPSTLCDVKVSAGGASFALAKGFSYERLRLTDSNLSLGCANGGQKMILRGAGLAFTKESLGQTQVLFDVLDQTTRSAEIDVAYKAELESERWDGTWLPIRTPDLSGHDQAKILATVTLGTGGQITAELPGFFQVVADAVNCPALSISPATGSICGGERVTIKGKGFSRTPPAKIRFGGVDAPGRPTVEDDKTVKVDTPEVPEGTGRAAVILLGSGDQEIGSVPGGFTFLDTEFLRGDADGNGEVKLNDAVVILRYLARGDATPRNLDGADADDNDKVEVTDAVLILNFLFKDGRSPLPPYPQPGVDPNPDNLKGCN